MSLIHKLCSRLGHPFRRRIKTEVHMDGHFCRCRWYICRCCGEVVVEENQ